MRKKLIEVIALTMLSAGVFAQFGGGSGTSADPYLITSAQDLKTLSDKVKEGTDYYGQYFKLTSDIDLSSVSGAGNSWQPIGSYSKWSDSKPFDGNFDGGNHTVRNLYVNNQDQSYQGLFGIVRNARIENLKVENAQVTSGLDYAGGVVGGLLEGSTLKNVSVSKGKVSAERSAGGVVGVVSDKSIVEGATNDGVFVSAERNVGGVAGWVDRHSAVKASNNGGNLNGSRFNVGGVVGNLTKNSCVENSANYGQVYSAAQNVGGIVGYADNSSISKSVNTGLLSSTGENVGGVVGYARRSDIDNAVNAAFVQAKNAKAAGGIAGYAADATHISKTINVNDAKASEYAGGIVGYKKTVKVSDSFYDRQLCVADNVYGRKASDSDTSKRYTNQMVGEQLKSHLGTENWTYADNYYPRLSNDTIMDVAHVASMPVFLTDNSENIYAVDKKFTNKTANNSSWSSNYTAVSASGTDVALIAQGIDTLIVNHNGKVYRKFPLQVTGPVSAYIIENNFTDDVNHDTTLHVINGLPKGVWSSSNENVATVDQNGNVTPKAAGTTTICYTLPSGAQDCRTLTYTGTINKPAPVVVNDARKRAQELAEKLMVHFDFNNTSYARMNKEEQAVFDELAQILKENKDINLELTGHTCNIGSHAVNQKIGQKRAETVKKMFINQGVAANQLSTKSKSYDAPLVPNNSNANRKQNRRVQGAIK